MESYFPNVQGVESRMARERVLEDLRVLVVDAETLLNATVGDLTDKAAEARDRLKAGVVRAKATLVDLQRAGMESAREVAQQADSAIRDHPYKSLGIAVGAGVLIGFLLGRR